MIACPRCGHPNDTPSPFCTSCGAVLARRGGSGQPGSGETGPVPPGETGSPPGQRPRGPRPGGQQSGGPQSGGPRQWAQDPRLRMPADGRARGRRGHDTGELDAEPPAATCPRCGEPNLAGQDWCPRCGLPLREAAERTAPAYADDEGYHERVALAAPWWRSQGFVLGALLGVLVLIGVVVFNMGSGGEQPEEQPQVVDAADVASAPESEPAAAPAPAPSPSEPRDETQLSVAGASASSVLGPDGDVSYDPQLTLDGQPATAWNDGVSGDPTGEWLEYTFSAPVRVTRIEVINGYDKVVDDLDLFAANARVRELRVETDDATTEAELADTRDPQSVDGPFGPACRFRVLVDSVYPGERFDDVAVSEVAFYGTQELQGAC